MDEHLPEIRQPASAELLRHVERVEAELDGALADLAALFLGVLDHAGLLQLLRVLLLDGLDLALDEVADGAAQLDQLGWDLDDAHLEVPLVATGG